MCAFKKMSNSSKFYKSFLRYHQKDAIRSINKNFKKENNRGIINMFCGSGKTMILFHQIIDETKDVCVVVFPSLELIRQFHKDYLVEFKDYILQKKILVVCSEKSSNVNATTDVDVINNFLLNEFQKIICVTYQSLNILTEIDINIDLILFDEAHHTKADKTKMIIKELTFNNSL